MTEFDSLLNEIDDDKRLLAADIIEKMSFIRQQLTDLEKMPFIETKPDNPAKQRVTPAGRQYKELSQSYNAYIKTLLSMMKKQSQTEKVSPLREYFKNIETR